MDITIDVWAVRGVYAVDGHDTFLVDFKLEGPGLVSTINLHDLITSLSEFHNTLDKTYAVLTGQQRLSKTDRQEFQIRAGDFRHGSFITTLEIVTSGTQLALPILGLANPYTVWEYTRLGFEFLKSIYMARAEHKEATIHVENNSQVIVIVGGEPKFTCSDPKVIDIADRAKKSYSKMASILDEDSIRNVRVGPKDAGKEQVISISAAERDLFQLPTLVQSAPVTFDADIFDFNKDTNAGKLRAIGGQSIPEGNYAFSVIGGQDRTKYIESMLHSGVQVTALEERENDPIHGPTLVRFQVIEVVSKH